MAAGERNWSGVRGMAGDRRQPAPASHRSAGPVPWRRLNRRSGVHLLVGFLVFGCLVALVSYLGAARDPEPAGTEPAGPGAGPERPGAAFPGNPTIGAAAPASPGLRPRQRPTRPPTPTPRPSPTPTAAPTSAAPPPALTVVGADVPATVDLTAVGTTDWVHWGPVDGVDVVRRRGGSGEIVDEGGPGPRGGYDANPEGFGWRDGDPVERVDSTMAGANSCGVGNGFRLAVAGNGAERTAVVYAGVWMARGRLDLRLSSGGPTTSLRLEDPHTSHTAQFTVRFRAAAGVRLQIGWTVEESFTGCGNVGLQAVALR
ncbi:hypothetical protein [Micromonospora siamensis]|uniref:NPCBM/NEW2 domain-containing protein n=1 Tax=Micromonospora siamensis TaxID=299152 RepID=A0A1C5HIG4_9ACTN|nr:hypothetical protein [Micromonospora siamensis]SCG45785.1 hypothetical protein GA0074704_1791 [Micromonospora siamensis]